MKVCVYGAGVIGGILASAIGRAGHEVSVIARGANLDAIRTNGLTVRADGNDVTTRPAASQNPADFGPQDLVIVATKTHSLSDVAMNIAPLLGPETLVAFAVNGIFWFYGDALPGDLKLQSSRLDPADALRKQIGVDRAVGIVSITGGASVAPGIVHASRRDGQFIAGGALPAMQERVETIFAALKPVDIRLEVSKDIRRDMWRKYFGVVGNHATCALTGGTIAQVHADPGTQQIYLDLVSEAHQVAAAHGFTDLGFDIEKARANPATSGHKPSMLQDLEAGRQIELESTYVVLQDLARQLDLATPTLDLVISLLGLRSRILGQAGRDASINPARP
ncbi:MAG: 2-dehydropantoate 2-reductase [Hyphomicrobiales bacterium]|nr:2-dehydropantoate 2-reductase [Hyphomicrobiales bacterium]